MDYITNGYLNKEKAKLINITFPGDLFVIPVDAAQYGKCSYVPSTIRKPVSEIGLNKTNCPPRVSHQTNYRSASRPN